MALALFSLSASASPADATTKAPEPARTKTGIVISPLLDAMAQEKILDVARLPKAGVSGVRIADIRKLGPNPHINGFPQPAPFDLKQKVKLERNADGLMLKAESEYAEQDAGLSEFLTEYYIPTIPKVREGVTEEEKSKVRISMRPADDALQIHENLIYNKIGQRALLLDLYKPKENASKPWPVVIMVHGGGWSKGSHRYLRPLAMSLAAKGFACITVEYRLAGETSFPAAVWDVKAAVRWVKKNAKPYNLDTDFITLAGASAGGNIAGLVGVTEGDPRFEGDGEHREFSSKVHGIISLDGAIGWFGKQWSVLPNKDPWLHNEAIPLFHIIRNNQCPRFLFVGGGERIAEWVTKNIADSHAQYLEFRWPHAFELFDPAKDELVTLMADYLIKQQGDRK